MMPYFLVTFLAFKDVNLETSWHWNLSPVQPPLAATGIDI